MNRRRMNLRVVFRLMWGLLAGGSFSLAQGQTLLSREAWTDSVLRTLSTDQKIGQLLMVATYSNKDETEYRYIEKLIRDYHLGGLIFMQGNPADQVRLVNRYQAVARIPLLMAQDAEWGLSMRLTQAPGYPKNITLGAIENDSLLYQMGTRMAWELRRVGVSLNFAPVIDVNNNAMNPVIGFRSFGENKYNVARKGLMLARGLQDHGVIACAKHFPGHGDTDTDSHVDLPVISHPLARLDTLELYPFARLAEGGVSSMIVGHLFVPALDPNPATPTTLSPRVVQGVLRDSLGYQGLIITDALNMQGVTQYAAPGEAALKALIAGNDILLFPENIPLSVQMIREAVDKRTVSPAVLDAHVRRVLGAKYDAGLYARTAPSLSNLLPELNAPEHLVLRKQLYEAAMTLVKNDSALIPLRNLPQHRIAYVQIGGGSGNAFDRTLQKYGDVTPFYLRKGFTTGERDKVLGQLQAFTTVIIGVYDLSNRPGERYGVHAGTVDFCQQVTRSGKKTILTVFGTPYALQYFGTESAILVAYEAVNETSQAAAAAIFGGQPVTGRLPVTASAAFPAGTGIMIRETLRLGFALPEEVGLDSRRLARIDTLADTYITRMAMPGCAVLVIRHGKIVWDKGYGLTAYGAQGHPIDPLLHTYDLASVTKVAATTVCVMRLVEQGLLDLDRPIEAYLPELAGTDKASLTARRLLQHNAGLPSFIPFYLDTYSDPGRRLLHPRFFSYRSGPAYPLRIASGLYGSPALDTLVWNKIRETTLPNGSRMVYSDISMMLMARIVERLAGQSLDACADAWFYQPLGMSRTCFKPVENGDPSYCPPTEYDTDWRNTTIQGYVHDPAAALLGGVSGHAGLFASVHDLGKLLYMLENQGSYGGDTFLQPETIQTFTARQHQDSRRGLGWDKPDAEQTGDPVVSAYASALTFGHTGFTGTCVWVDPAQDLIYVFLSNRTYPRSTNKLLQTERVRQKIFDAVYMSLSTYAGGYPMYPQIR